jgi:hypothetical protein
MTPLDAARSTDDAVDASAVTAADGSEAIAFSNFFICVFIADFTIRLRKFFFSFTFTRLMADFMFGMNATPYHCKNIRLGYFIMLRVKMQALYRREIIYSHHTST